MGCGGATTPTRLISWGVSSPDSPPSPTTGKVGMEELRGAGILEQALPGPQRWVSALIGNSMSLFAVR